jgi:hypothetical protein
MRQLVLWVTNALAFTNHSDRAFLFTGVTFAMVAASILKAAFGILWLFMLAYPAFMVWVYSEYRHGVLVPKAVMIMLATILLGSAAVLVAVMLVMAADTLLLFI